jgi:hypothetical protein
MSWTYRPTSKCPRCGRVEISEQWGEEDNIVVTCWSCGHRVVEGHPNAVGCRRCGNPDASEYYDSTDAIVVECRICNPHDRAEAPVLETPRPIQCTQCGSLRAVEFFEEVTRAVEILCCHCGHTEYTGPIWDDKLMGVGWKREVRFGAGYMEYRPTGGSVTMRALHTSEEVVAAEELLRDKLLSGEYEEYGTWLTRWNQETKQVETVLGTETPPAWITLNNRSSRN